MEVCCRTTSIDFGLHTNVRRSLKLKIATTFVLIQLSRQCPFDVTRPRIVTFDEIAVVGVHDAHQLRQIRGGARMQGTTESG